MTKEFIHSMHAFRGFAIVNIVAIHAVEFMFYFAGTAENPPGSALKFLGWGDSILFHDSTLYFTFISGILFSLVLAERGYSQFFKSKFSYVVLPYLVFTALFTWINWSFEGVRTVFAGSPIEFIILVGKNFFSGGAIFTFWYIPVLMVLYLLTPALARLMAIEKAKWLVALIILAPLVCSRAWPDITWTNFAYFTGAYMLGLLVGANFRKTIELTERYVLLVAAVAIGSTILLVALFSLDSPKWGIVTFAESAWYIQKIAISALAILIFDRIMAVVPKWLDVLGNYAFAIYFLHAYLLFEMYTIMENSIAAPESTPLIVIFAISNVVVVILASVLITYGCKRILGRWSRYAVGA